MPNLRPILNHLHRAQLQFLRSADAIPAEQWTTRLDEETWSAGEVVAHLITVERTILDTAGRIRQKSPRPIPFLKRFHLPLALAESRLIRRKTPIPLDATLLSQKEEMLAELRAVREQSLEFLSKTHSQDLRVYRWPHPFLGMLNTYEWFHMIAAHEIRHTKQVLEIASNLPKHVENRQKWDEIAN
jgi:uncharacterized damage-inducible protein DinB